MKRIKKWEKNKKREKNQNNKENHEKFKKNPHLPPSSQLFDINEHQHHWKFFIISLGRHQLKKATSSNNIEPLTSFNYSSCSTIPLSLRSTSLTDREKRQRLNIDINPNFNLDRNSFESNLHNLPKYLDPPLVPINLDSVQQNRSDTQLQYGSRALSQIQLELWDLQTHLVI